MLEIEFAAPAPELAPLFLEYRQDPEVLRFNPVMPATLETLRERLANASSDLSQFHTRDEFMWFLRVGADIVGQVTLKSINRMMLTAEVGYGLSARFRGRGITTVALRQLSAMVFRETPIRKLTAYVHEQNMASRRVMEKVGYRQEGILREHYIVNGAPANEVVYGLLKREWDCS